MKPLLLRPFSPSKFNSTVCMHCHAKAPVAFEKDPAGHGKQSDGVVEPAMGTHLRHS
jgi:hypothetical protein